MLECALIGLTGPETAVTLCVSKANSGSTRRRSINEGEAGLIARNATLTRFRAASVPPFGQQARATASIAAGAIIALQPAQIERPGSPSITCWRSKGRSPGFHSDAVWTTR